MVLIMKYVLTKNYYYNGKASRTSYGIALMEDAEEMPGVRFNQSFPKGDVTLVKVFTLSKEGHLSIYFFCNVC